MVSACVKSLTAGLYLPVLAAATARTRSWVDSMVAASAGVGTDGEPSFCCATEEGVAAEGAGASAAAAEEGLAPEEEGEVVEMEEEEAAVVVVVVVEEEEEEEEDEEEDEDEDEEGGAASGASAAPSVGARAAFRVGCCGASPRGSALEAAGGADAGRAENSEDVLEAARAGVGTGGGAVAPAELAGVVQPTTSRAISVTRSTSPNSLAAPTLHVRRASSSRPMPSSALPLRSSARMHCPSSASAASASLSAFRCRSISVYAAPRLHSAMHRWSLMSSDMASSAAVYSAAARE